MESHRKKLWIFFLALVLTEVIYRPIAMLEGNSAFLTIEYNVLLNVHGFLFAVAFMCALDLYFLARRECVKLGLYSVTPHRTKRKTMGLREKLATQFGKLKTFLNDKRAISSSGVIGLAISFFLVAILGPIAIGTIANTTTTNWSPAVVTVFQVVCPIIWTIGVAIRYLPGKE